MSLSRARGVRGVRAVPVLLCVMATLLVAARATAQQTHILVVTGVPGDAEHAEKFDRWAKTFLEAAKKKDAVPDSNITYLADKQATKPAVERALVDLAAKAKPSDTVLVLLIGHGSFDGSVAAFNLPGPDLTAADYGHLLAKFGNTQVVFVNTASSSGAPVEEWAAVVSAAAWIWMGWGAARCGSRASSPLPNARRLSGVLMACLSICGVARSHQA